MILNGCLVSSRVPHLLSDNSKGCRFRSYDSTITGTPCSLKKVVSLYGRSLLGPCPNIKPSASLGIQQFHLSAASSRLSHGEHGGLFHAIPKLPKRSRRPLPPRASLDWLNGFKAKPMTKKPRWWWRTLACIPYLLPLHGTWMYAETAYHFSTFLQDFEALTYPFLTALGALPRWCLMAYFFTAYLGVVRRREWPHFFRFHVVLGMLLEIGLQLVGCVSNWMPKGLYWGMGGMHFWVFFAFGFLFTVLECMRCALAGMYADVPFVSDAAYIQMPYD